MTVLVTLEDKWNDLSLEEQLVFLDEHCGLHLEYHTKQKHKFLGKARMKVFGEYVVFGILLTYRKKEYRIPELLIAELETFLKYLEEKIVD